MVTNAFTSAFLSPTPLFSRPFLAASTHASTSSPCPRPTAVPSRRAYIQPPTCRMVRVSVPIHIETPPPFAYNLFSDLSRMPEWSTTLKSVTRDPADPAFSTWKFSWSGVNLSWRARDKEPEAGKEQERAIRWGSVSGLKHTGLVQFLDEGKGETRMTMTVEYDVASLVAVLMSTSMVSNFVESAIETELQRFRNFALRALRKQKIQSRGTA